MASLRDIAKEYKEIIMDGIAWVAIWKQGRSWNARAFWLDCDTDKIERDDVEDAKEIMKQDANAIFINEYYDAHLGEGAINDIVKGIRWMYEGGGHRVIENYLPEEEHKHKWTGRVEALSKSGKLEEVAIVKGDSLKQVYKTILAESRSQKVEAVAEIYEDVEDEEIRFLRSNPRYSLLKGENGLIFLVERNRLGEKIKSCRIREDHTGYSAPMARHEPKEKYKWIGRVRIPVLTNSEENLETVQKFTGNAHELKEVYKKVLEACKQQPTPAIGEIYKCAPAGIVEAMMRIPKYTISKHVNNQINLIAQKENNNYSATIIRNKKYKTQERKENAAC